MILWSNKCQLQFYGGGDVWSKDGDNVNQVQVKAFEKGIIVSTKLLYMDIISLQEWSEGIPKGNEGQLAKDEEERYYDCYSDWVCNQYDNEEIQTYFGLQSFRNGSARQYSVSAVRF